MFESCRAHLAVPERCAFRHMGRCSWLGRGAGPGGMRGFAAAIPRG